MRRLEVSSAEKMGQDWDELKDSCVVGSLAWKSDKREADTMDDKTLAKMGCYKVLSMDWLMEALRANHWVVLSVVEMVGKTVSNLAPYSVAPSVERMIAKTV